MQKYYFWRKFSEIPGHFMTIHIIFQQSISTNLFIVSKLRGRARGSARIIGIWFKTFQLSTSLLRIHHMFVPSVVAESFLQTFTSAASPIIEQRILNSLSD